ncbi:MAG: peptidoglycan recognition family protein [Cyanobacteriota bacterium]|nr:peptidoglycan recognition family protein [Cyanobacteriota bacterium]MDY6364842.1 peptidoglycan recognition family protein [Cyanobacteriota bacterium]
MKRIIIHWTAGTGLPNSTDYQHYHKLITKDGLEINGKFPISANEVCREDKNHHALYAAHTGGGNTGSIGVSMCGMAVPPKTPVRKSKYPLTKVQCEKTFKVCAELCKKYGISVTSDTVMTHYEFGKKHPKTASAGKIDIIYLPPYPNIAANKVGDFIRNKTIWYLKRL